MGSRPLFTNTGGAEIRVSDFSLYLQISADNGNSGPIIYGRAPNELVATYGLPAIVPGVDPGYAGSVPKILIVGTPTTPGVPTVDGTNLVGPGGFSRPVSLDDPGGTLVGVNWVDALGVTHPDVDWEWQVDLFALNVQPNPPAGVYSQQIVTWTGDGNAGGQQIPTTFPLNVGVSAVWVFPETNAPSGVAQFLRTTGMPGTISPASGVPNTLGGVMTLDASGFTVKNHAPSLTLVNSLGAKYTAVVLNDTSGAVLSVGSYAGLGAIVKGPVACGLIPEILWIWGVGSFRSTDYGLDTDNISSLLYNLVVPAGGRITKFGDPGPSSVFDIGTDSAFFSNDAGTTYYFLVMSRTGYATALAANLVKHFRRTGEAAPTVRVPLPFTPGFAHTSVITGASSLGAYWRSPWCLGTASHSYDTATELASLGIEEFGVDYLDLGHTAAPNGSNSYGMAWKTAGSIDVPADPTVTVVPPGTYPVPPDAGPGAACTAPVFP